jgi:predicted O-linked N-acetylglucosamine transferase (SPINDLY family)
MLILGIEVDPLPNVLSSPAIISFDKIANNIASFASGLIFTSAVVLKAACSKLFLRYLYYKSSFYRSYMLKIFTDAGIEEDRIDIALLPIENCLDLYNDMDIVLDPFPYNGGTISSEALYMNTPIITLAGTNYVSRIGVSLLSNLKLEKYIAYSYEEYIQKVIDLANNENELKKLHTTIRNKMLECDLGNSISFTKNIENAYIDIMNKYHN